MSLYFAYGTYLNNPDWLGCDALLLDGQPKPRPSAYAVLPDSALVFLKSPHTTNEVHCALTDATGQCVWGTLISLPDGILNAVSEANAETHDRVQKSVTVRRLAENHAAPASTTLTVGEKTTAVCFVAKADGAAAVLPDSRSLQQVLMAALQYGFPMSYVRAVAAAGAGAGLTVDDIVLGRKDLSEKEILQIYYKSPPRFAVYSTAPRVLVQYADDNVLAEKQRGCMASLNALRTQISGLIDGWQSSNNPKNKCKAAKYNARVAAALNLCLEGDGVNAFASLQEVKGDILDERASWGRFQYLICALLTAFVYFAGLGLLDLLERQLHFSLGESSNVMLAAQAGAIGAFFSIAIAIRKRTVLTDLRSMDNYADSALRITIGVIAAAVLCLLLRTNLAPPFMIKGAGITGPNVSRDIIVTFGFIAGFLERLVPDMLSKVATSEGNGAPKGR